MAATRFSRTADYTDDEANSVSGRSTVKTASLDAELDDVVTATDNHADLLDVLLRDDQKMQDNILQGHEFSSAAIGVISALLGLSDDFTHKGTYSVSNSYAVLNMAENSGNTYISLKVQAANAYPDFASALADGAWTMFAAAGSTGLPTYVADRVLGNNGAALDWRQITTTEAPTLAPLANPTFTGVVGAPDINFSGRMNFSVETVTFSAAGNVFNFDTQFMKRIDVTGNYTGANTASNITQGDVMEVHFNNTSGADAALLWDSNWVWMGYAPDTLPTGKKAVLTLRAPTGATASDIVALWSIQP